MKDDIPEWAKDDEETEKMWTKTDETVERDVGKVKEPDKVGEDEDIREDESDEIIEDDTEESDDEDDTEESDEDEEDIVEVEDDEDDNEAIQGEEELQPSPDTATLDDIVGEAEKKDDNSTPLNSEKGTDTPTEGEKAVKKRSRLSFKDWLNGTPDNPLPLFSLRAKFKRWRLIHFHNHVWLRIMSYDRNTHEYTIYENLIHKSNLPKTAVHCTNEKNVYFDKLFDVPYEPWKDNGFGAMNAYLYMKDTSIDEALLLLWQGPKMNMRTLAIIGIVVVAALFYIFYMMQ